MAMPRKQIDFDRIYTSNNSGDFRIIEELEPIRYGTSTIRIVKVQFLYSNYIGKYRLYDALSGAIRDPYFPSVCGVGYLGEIDKGSVPKVIYDMWYHMIERCYDSRSSAYKSYGALGVRVDPRWLCLAYFVQDLPNVMGYSDFANNPNEVFSIDKDILQQGVPDNQKIYSLSTTALIPGEDNSRTNKLVMHQRGCSSEYYGLYKTPYNTFQCTVMINGIKYFLGTYRNEIAAANVYNYVVGKVIPSTPLNNVPFMPIGEALSYYSGKKPITVPPQMSAADKFIFDNACNCGSKYIGIGVRGDAFTATFHHNNSNTYNLGTYDSEIAAANMYNIAYNIAYPNVQAPNIVHPMTIGEVLQHRKYARGKVPVEMCHIVDKDKNNEKKA